MPLIQTPADYYGDPNLYGGYQYTSLKEVLDAMELESLDTDSYLKATTRFKMLYHARMAIKELNKRAASDILAIEVTVPPSLVWVIPQDYINWVRISVVISENGTKRLRPLNINRNISIATGYLQDNNYEIMFDANGQVLTADLANNYATPYFTYQFDHVGGQSYLDTSLLSEFGEFNIDERRGQILFSSQLSDREVVIEYISDGLQASLSESEITIHKDVEEAVKAFIYHGCISMRRNVPFSEKQRAKLDYKTKLHQAKIDRSDITILEINRAMRTKTMQP